MNSRPLSDELEEQVSKFRHDVLLGDRSDEHIVLIQCLAERLFPVIQGVAKQIDEIIYSVSLPQCIRSVLSGEQDLEALVQSAFELMAQSTRL